MESQGFTPTRDGVPNYGVGEVGATKTDVVITAPATDDAKRWTGWHSQIAPGHENWLIARKPTKLTYAQQLPEHGCGAFNVDACRVPRGEGVQAAAGSMGASEVYGEPGAAYTKGTGREYQSSGSHPRNVVLSTGGDGCPARGLDSQSGVMPSSLRGSRRPFGGGTCYGDYEGGERGSGHGGHDDSGGASRYFTRFGAGPAWATPAPIGSRADVRARAQRVLASMGGGVLVELPEDAACDEPSGQAWALPPLFDAKVGYFPKASDRSVPGRPDLRNEHPTHKHPELMRWLVRLMAATAEHTGDKPAVVLDPFMGSGTTGWACAAEGVRFIGIERDPKHFEVARARILGAQGSPEEAAKANEVAPKGAQLGLL
jgi:site-specific DNA-methyltransferase (adenine-specific)